MLNSYQQVYGNDRAGKTTCVRLNSVVMSCSGKNCQGMREKTNEAECEDAQQMYMVSKYFPTELLINSKRKKY